MPFRELRNRSGLKERLRELRSADTRDEGPRVSRSARGAGQDKRTRHGSTFMWRSAQGFLPHSNFHARVGKTPLPLIPHWILRHEYSGIRCDTRRMNAPVAEDERFRPRPGSPEFQGRASDPAVHIHGSFKPSPGRDPAAGREKSQGGRSRLASWGAVHGRRKGRRTVTGPDPAVSSSRRGW